MADVEVERDNAIATDGIADGINSSGVVGKIGNTINPDQRIADIAIVGSCGSMVECQVQGNNAIASKDILREELSR